MTPDEFKKMRKAAGMTQAQMAERLDVSRRTIISWEAGEFSLPADIADRIASEGLQSDAASKVKQLTQKSHPQCFRLHHPGHYLRTYLHPHWYLQCSAIQQRLTKEQVTLADAYVTTTEHYEAYKPLAPDAAVTFIKGFGIPEPEARYVARQYGFAVPHDNPPITDADLIK